MAEHWDAQLREFLQGAVNGKVREIAKRKKKKDYSEAETWVRGFWYSLLNPHLGPGREAAVL